MIADMRADVMRYLDGAAPTPGKILRCLATEFGLQATLVYRFGRALRSTNSRPWLWPFSALGWLVYFVLSFLVRKLYGIEFALSAEIGRGLYVGHFGGIRVVNSQVGEFVTIGEQCRIGSPGAAGPTIGSRVWLGGHVQIPGQVEIADRVTICSGALVVENVPPRAMLGGRPARILSRDYDNERILGSGIESESVVRP